MANQHGHTHLQGKPSDYEGHILREHQAATTYLILDGRARHVPDGNTFTNLFAGTDKEEAVNILQFFQAGDRLSNGAVLAEEQGKTHLYLISNGKKRHITSEDAVSKYHFLGERNPVLRALLDAIPSGANIDK